MAEAERTPILPAHAEGTVEAIARLHAEHRKCATPFQKAIEGLTARTGRPSSIGWLTAAVVGWVGLNVALVAVGRTAFDEAPFAWMELVACLAALYVTVMILATQRRDDELASQRDQLTLELAILADRKSVEDPQHQAGRGLIARKSVAAQIGDGVRAATVFGHSRIQNPPMSAEARCLFRSGPSAHGQSLP